MIIINIHIIFSFHKGSLIKALQFVYSSSYSKKVWEPLSQQFYNQLINQQEYIQDVVAKALHIETIPDDWYEVSGADVEREGGGPVLNVYGGSLSKMLRAVYPEQNWQLWKFKVVPR